MADTERHDETARAVDLGCGCDDNGGVGHELLELALDDGQEVELPCGHTVSPPAAQNTEQRPRAVERPRWLDQQWRDIDRNYQFEDPVHVGRVMRVHATALGLQDDRGLSAGPSRREVSEVIDELVPFAELGSLTDRARLREQVMTRLTDTHHRQRGRGGSSL